MSHSLVGASLSAAALAPAARRAFQRASALSSSSYGIISRSFRCGHAERGFATRSVRGRGGPERARAREVPRSEVKAYAQAAFEGQAYAGTEVERGGYL